MHQKPQKYYREENVYSINIFRANLRKFEQNVLCIPEQLPVPTTTTLAVVLRDTTVQIFVFLNNF